MPAPSAHATGRLPLLLGAAVAATGLAVLAGWALAAAPLKSVLPGLPSMNPMVAVGFVLAGASLVLQASRPSAPGRILGALVVALGLARVVEYALGVPLGVDTWMFGPDVRAAQGHANIAPNSAFCFVLMGVALATLDARLGRVRLAGALAGTAAVVASLTVIAYAFGLRAFGGALRVFPMALHTGVGFVLLGIGILLARPARGVAAILGARNEGGAVARRLLPVAVGVPLALGYAILALHREGLYDTTFALTLFAVATALVLGAVIVAESSALARADERRRAAEAALEAQARQTEQAERATGRGSWAWDLDHDRARWSAGMYRLLGVDPATFDNANESFLALVHPDDRARMGQAMAGALRDGGAFLQEYRIVRPDGAIRHLKGEGQVVLTDGKARLMYGFVQDVTEVRALEEAARRDRAARQANEAELERVRRNEEFLTGFVNSTAHELATPLTPVLLQMHVLRRDPRKASPEAIELLARNIERLRQAVDGIVAAARVQGRQTTVAIQPLDLGAFLKAEMAARPSTAPAVTARGGPLMALADPAALRQVLGNLLDNAVRLTPAAGRVEVTWSARGDQARVEVRDTGVGFSAEDGRKLFRPYGQAHAGLRTESGIGLGLYVVGRLVGLMGGEVGAESPGPGRGAVFWFTLPRPGPEPAPVTPA